MGPLRLLTLALVGVLVTAESLRRGEVAAAVVAFELPSVLIGPASGGAGGRMVAAGGGEVEAKKADFWRQRRRRRWRLHLAADEGELGEGVNGYEVVGFSVVHFRKKKKEKEEIDEGRVIRVY